MSYQRKKYIWLPYASSIEVKPSKVKIVYKDGQIEETWKDIHSIMFYGESVNFPQEFLEKCSFYKIPIIIHRRNLSRAVVIASSLPQDQENIVTKQILYRENEKKSTYIAKKLIQAKFKSCSWLIPNNYDLLYKIFDLKKILSKESWHARIYWKEFYLKLNYQSNRRNKDKKPVEKVLNAVSKFISGIILRWILYHQLSPYHGFLHKPTDYPSLVYDLMEPYRGYFDKVVFDTFKEFKIEEFEEKESLILAKAINNIKKFLDEKVYVEATRQVVTFHELFHGIVLSLRSYLLNETKKFIIPTPGKPNGGRPIKAGYKLYGHEAGITNFWPETYKIANNFERQYYQIEG